MDSLAVHLPLLIYYTAHSYSGSSSLTLVLPTRPPLSSPTTRTRRPSTLPRLASSTALILANMLAKFALAASALVTLASADVVPTGPTPGDTFRVRALERAAQAIFVCAC